MEKTQKEAIVAFMKSNEFKIHLDRHYIVGYKDFCFDAKEAYLEMDFDFFKIPIAVESSLPQTSFEDVNIMDDASTEATQDVAETSKDDPKSGDNALSGLSQ